MNYYKIYGADNFEHVNFLDESYYEKLTQLKSQKIIEFGDKPQVELAKPDWRQKAKKADFPGYGTNFIFMRDYVYDKDKAFFEQFGVLYKFDSVGNVLGYENDCLNAARRTVCAVTTSRSCDACIEVC